MKLVSTLIIAILLSGCVAPGEEQLVFVERAQDTQSGVVEEVQQSLAPVVKDQVQLQESNMPSVKVAVIPFTNMSGNENFDYFKQVLLTDFQRSLSELARYSDSVIYSEEEYQELLETMGYSDIVAPDQQIASYLRSAESVEYIIHGEIEVNEEEGRMILRPVILQVGEFDVEFVQVGSYSLLLKDIFNLNPIVQAVINNIDQLAEA